MTFTAKGLKLDTDEMKSMVVEFNNGEIYYIKDGEFHREDGPAMIVSDQQRWFRNGLLHREDGPAVMYTDGKSKGKSYWCLNGQDYTKAEWEKIIAKKVSSPKTGDITKNLIQEQIDIQITEIENELTIYQKILELEKQILAMKDVFRK